MLPRWSLWVSLPGLALLLACSPRAAGTSASSPGRAGGRLVLKDKTYEKAVSMADLLEGATPQVVEIVNCTFAQGLRIGDDPSALTVVPYSVYISGSTFGGVFDGAQCQFLGQLSLSKCRFKVLARLDNSTCFALGAFKDCIFDEEASFIGGIFMREASFMGSHFFGIVRMQAARFMSSAQFSNGLYQKNADFTLCRFDAPAYFDYTRFLGKADLSNARAESTVSFRQAQVATLDLRKVVGGTLESSGLQCPSVLEEGSSLHVKGN